ncbi:uncharacterized protein Dana_GF15544 [Drosophila ananassae]|uniref:Uncharacterized protein n=1 Tax=Drosophila ananassae TaxID=7217 RepID=B3MM03_DROAN|nr:uncharacterized protein LOC6498352 [Drosophila ananassae]EDV31831.1 uncharacterized protein Dana_GF15544 [Drosophila ananassae]
MGDFVKGNILKRKEKPFSFTDSHIPLLGESSTKIEYLEDGSELKYDAVSAEQLFQVLEMQSGSSTAVNVMEKLLPKQNPKSGRPEIINSLLLRPDSIKKISKTELVEQINSSNRRPKIVPYKIVKNKDSFGKHRSPSRQSTTRKQKKQQCEDDFDEIPDPGQLSYKSGELTSMIAQKNHMEEAIQSERDPEGGRKKCERDSIENNPPQKPNAATCRAQGSRRTLKKPRKYLRSKEYLNENTDPGQLPDKVSESTLRMKDDSKKEVNHKYEFFEIKVSPRRPLNVTYNVARSRDIFGKSKSPNRQIPRKQKKTLRVDYLNDIPDAGKLPYKTGKPTSRITPNNYMEGSRDLDGDSTKLEYYDCIEIRDSPLTPNGAKNIVPDCKDLVVKTESDDSIELNRYISVERVEKHQDDPNRTRTLYRWPANMRAPVSTDKLSQQVYAFVRHAMQEIADNSNPINAPRVAPVLPNIAKCLKKPIDKFPITISDERIAAAPKMAEIIPAPPKGRSIIFDLDEYVFPRQEDLNRMNLHHFGRPSGDENLSEELRKRTLLLINYAQELLNEFDRRQVENEKYWAQRSNEESNLVSYLDPAPSLKWYTLILRGAFCLVFGFAAALAYYVLSTYYSPKPPPTFWERILMIFRNIYNELLFR